MRDAVIVFAVIVFGALMVAALLSQRGTPRGPNEGRLAPVGPKPNTVSSEEGVPEDARVAPLAGTLADAKAAILATGGTIVTETDDYLAATYATRLFRFVDDVEVRDAGGGVVHIRSGSRVGYSDMGANKKRVARIRAAMSRT